MASFISARTPSVVGGRHAEDGGQEALGWLCKLGLETLELRMGGSRLMLRTGFRKGQFLGGSLTA